MRAALQKEQAATINGLGFCSPAGPPTSKGVTSAATTTVTASTSPADSHHSNSESGSPAPVLQQQLRSIDIGASPTLGAPADQGGVANTPASEIQGVIDAGSTGICGMSNESVCEIAAAGGGGEDSPDESFDMLANMPPTPGGLAATFGADADGGGGGSYFDGEAEGDLADVLAGMVPDLFPTTPAAASVAQQQQGGARRSPRLAAASSGAGSTRADLGRVNKAGGVGGGGATTGAVKTPYSSRRKGRRAGERQAFPENAFTPGTGPRGGDRDGYGGDANTDDANASFMTAIMGSVDGGSGSTADPCSFLRGDNLFSAGSEPTTPVNVGIEGESAPTPPGGGGDGAGAAAAGDGASPPTPSFDMSLSSVEKRFAGLTLIGDDGTAAVAAAAAASPWPVETCAGAGGGGGADGGGGACGGGGENAPADLKDVTLDVDGPMPSHVLGAGDAASAAEGSGAGSGGDASDEVQRWPEPPSPAVAPPPSSSRRTDGGKPTFSPKDAAGAKSAEVSPYGSRSRAGGGPATSSTFVMTSDDEDEMLGGFNGSGGGAVAEITLPTLPKVEESRFASQQPFSPPALPADAVVAAAGSSATSGTALASSAQESLGAVAMVTDGDSDDDAMAGVRDVAGGDESNAEAADDGRAILDQMLLDASGSGGGLSGPGAGTGPSLAGAVPAAATFFVGSNGGEGNGGASAAVISAVEKEAMALAAACMAEQEAMNKAAPEAAGAGPEIASGGRGGAGREGANKEPEITGEEKSGGSADGENIEEFPFGTREAGAAAAAPDKAEDPPAALRAADEAKGGGLKISRVAISRVAVPAAVSTRRGSASGGGSRRSSIRPSSLGPLSSARSSSSSMAPPSPSTAPRRQPMAFGPRVSSSTDIGFGVGAAAPTAAGPKDGQAAAAAPRAPSRGRDRGPRERVSTGGPSQRRDGAATAATAAAAAATGAPAKAAAAPAPTAAVAVAPVDPSSRLLAPTKVSQSRARPRSASPAVSSARGRASTGGGFGGPGGPGAGPNRRMSAAGPTPLQQQQHRQEQQQQHQQQQQQQQQARPRSASTGRRALTMPKTPNLRTSNRSKGEKAQETTEESEVRKLHEMQEKLKQMTRRNQVVMEKSRRTAYSGNVRSSKPLTVPESPAMVTVGRLGGKVYASVGPQDHLGFSPTHPAKSDPLAKDNLAQLAAQPRGPTVPAPFQLSKSNRVSREGGGGSAPVTPRSKGDTLTFRESLARIENKTPDRFRSRPVGEQPKPGAPVIRVEPKPTLPKSPKFRTEARAAAHGKTHIMTPEEREEAELAEMKKHQFKARPYNADGFGVSGEKGVFRPQHSDKQLTQPEPFRLNSEDRASRRAPSPQRSRDEEELAKQFKARPMPGGRSSSVGRVRPGAKVNAELKPRELTVAASPALATKRRSALRSNSFGGGGVRTGALVGGAGAGMLTSEEAELEKAAANKFRARPMPDFSKLAQQSRRQSAAATVEPPPPPTEPRPFNLRSDTRGKAKQALLAQRVLDQRRQEEAAARVRARPLPAPSQGFFPQPSNRPLTETMEFHLSSQARHERAAQEFRDRVMKEEERARRAAEVIALPLPAATFEPELYPERTEVSLTQPIERVLHSSARAEGRAKWDEANLARLEEEERLRRAQAEAIAEAEKREIADLRRRSHAEGGMSFKAKPIKWNNQAPAVAQLSTAPLTTPITPNLRTKRRAAINASTAAAAAAAQGEPQAPIA